MSILGKVSTTNSLTGETYTSDQLVLYADISPCPEFTTITTSVKINFSYTVYGSGTSAYWVLNSAPTVTLDTKIPFSFYVCAKCLLSSQDSSPSGGFIVFTATLASDTIYTDRSLTYQSSTTVNPGHVPGLSYTSRKLNVSGISAGISKSPLSTSNAINMAVSNASLSENIVFNVSAAISTNSVS